MNPKFKITKVVLESLGLEPTDKRIKETIPTWWSNPRQKEKGGLRLTDQGFECFQKADIKFYRVQFDQKLSYTNQLVIWLDRYIDCPFYITNKEIYVFDEKMAIQLVLFSGNVSQFTSVKAKNAESA